MKYEYIENLIIKNGFKITSFEDNLYRFVVDNDKFHKEIGKILEMEKEVNELDKPGIDKETDAYCIKLYSEIKEKKEKLQKKYYPKLRPILDALNLFYSDRKIEYRYLIKLTDMSILCFFLGRNKSFDENINDENFKKGMAQELKDFNEFLKKRNL